MEALVVLVCSAPLTLEGELGLVLGQERFLYVPIPPQGQGLPWTKRLWTSSPKHHIKTDPHCDPLGGSPALPLLCDLTAVRATNHFAASPHHIILT